MDLSVYLPVILFILVGVGVGIAPAGARFPGSGPNRPDAAEELAVRMRIRGVRRRAAWKFDVRYYLVAILFILFDLEIVGSCSPWAVVSSKDIGAMRASGQ